MEEIQLEVSGWNWIELGQDSMASGRLPWLCEEPVGFHEFKERKELLSN